MNGPRLRRVYARSIPVTILMLILVAGSVQAQEPAAKRLVGLWKLTSRQQRLADGTTRKNPISVAYLIYTDTGHMCFVSMDPDRPKWRSSTPTAAEALTGLNGFGAYCSTVEAHASEGYVLHHVEISQAPNAVGEVRKRFFTFDGPNRLTLKVDPPELAAGVVEGTLVWERVTK